MRTLRMIVLLVALFSINACAKQQLELTDEEKFRETTEASNYRIQHTPFDFGHMNIPWILITSSCTTLFIGYVIGRSHGKNAMMMQITSDQMRMDTDRMWREALNRFGGNK
jgi:hypothetical protein